MHVTHLCHMRTSTVTDTCRVGRFKSIGFAHHGTLSLMPSGLDTGRTVVRRPVRRSVHIARYGCGVSKVLSQSNTVQSVQLARGGRKCMPSQLTSSCDTCDVPSPRYPLRLHSRATWLCPDSSTYSACSPSQSNPLALTVVPTT